MLGRSYYQITKSSIEQGIIQLQQKIRKRKQLELERVISQNIIGSDKLYQYELQLSQLHKVYDQAKHIPLVSNINYYNEINKIEPIYLDYPSKYDPFTLSKQEIQQKIRKETFHLEYLKRLEKIKRQNQPIEEKFSSIKKSFDHTENKNNQNYKHSGLLPEQPYYHRSNLGRQKQANLHHDRIDQSKENLASSVKKYPLDRSSAIKGFQYQDQLINSYQYDDPEEQDSSVLVDKYSKGLKAEQYYRDIRKLDELENKLKAIKTGEKINRKYHDFEGRITHQQPLIKKQNQNQKQFQRSPKKSPERTIQKSSIPIIKQDVQQGMQTVINSAKKNLREQKLKNDEVSTSEFLNQKLNKVINLQKKQSRVQDNSFPERPTRNPQRKSSSRDRISKNKLCKTIDISVLNKSDNSPIRRIRDQSQRKYKNPYLQNVKRNNSKQNKYNNKSAMVSQRNRSISKTHTSKKRQILTNQMLIPAPLYPESQTVNYQQTNMDRIRLSCNQKIEKRLKMSTIVFKDSNLRNTKHQIDHLWHKFQNQIKARKQIKDKINTNPRILRKHKMVVQ